MEGTPIAPSTAGDDALEAEVLAALDAGDRRRAAALALRIVGAARQRGMVERVIGGG
jgi:hypothetical protein